MQFTGKTALVTGAAGGIGSAVARAFAAAGANIVAADKDDVDATVGAARLSGAEAIGVSLDVTDPASIAAMVQQAESHFGGIDILVTAAGVTGFGSAATLDAEGPARKSTAAATSSAVPSLLSGIACLSASGKVAVMADAMGPGATALTVMADAASSRAR